MGVITRGKKLYVRFKNRKGEWETRATGLTIGSEPEAEASLKILEDSIRMGAPAFVVSTDGSRVTLADFARAWFERRKARVRSGVAEQGRIEYHVLPYIGSMVIKDIRPKHIIRLIEMHVARDKLAPRSIRHIRGVLNILFRDAVIDELIPSSPMIIPPGVLPPLEDKDPEWRHTAIFTREEAEQLISDRRILLDRRVLYALKLLGAMRHGEAAGLCWKHYEVDATPLGRLTIARSYIRKRTKTGVTRQMPVHETLAGILATWRMAGWEKIYGRKPKPDDLIVPTRRFTTRAAAQAQVDFLADMEKLGMRRRRGHDFRRTFITLARSDGARKDLLEIATHGPRGNDIMDLYTSFQWADICVEVAKLQLAPKRPSARNSEGCNEKSSTTRHSTGNSPDKTDSCEATPMGFESPLDSVPSAPPKSVLLTFTGPSKRAPAPGLPQSAANEGQVCNDCDEYFFMVAERLETHRQKHPQCACEWVTGAEAALAAARRSANERVG